MTETKNKILEAAEALVFENGIAETTITAVARKAGVADSLVYQHFKNKEDLLFSVTVQRLTEALALASEALQGIEDAESRLRKMIWHSLSYNDRHPGYMRTLLFECRSNISFYRTRGHDMIREHSNLVMDILRKGVQDGNFREDIDLRLVRDIIYGTLDFESISSIAIREINESVQDFDGILNLLLPMLRKTKASSRNGKEGKILEAAEAIFAEKGFNKATVQEIAKSVQMAEGSIYAYFRNKEDLLLSIPLKRLQKHIDALPEMFRIISPLRKLRRLIKYHFSLYLTNRNFLRVFLLDVQLNKRFYDSKAFDLFQTYLKTFEDIIEEGRSDGSFRSDVNPRVFRNMFLGAFSHMALRWVIIDTENKYDKLKEIEQLTDLLSDAVSAAPQ